MSLYRLIANNSGVGTSDTVTTTAIDSTGANLIVLGVSYNNGSTPTITDSKGNTYTALTAQSVAANGVSRLYYCYNPIVGTSHTVTNAVAGNFCTICVAAFYGPFTPPLDIQTGATNASASTLATGSITPTIQNALVVTHFMFSVAGTASIDSSFTITNQQNFGSGNNYGGALAYKIQTGAVAVNPTWTSGGGATGLAATIASFKPKVNTKSGIRPHPFSPGLAR